MRFRTILLYSLAATTIGTLQARADVPTSMSIQGRLTDSTGAPVAAGPKVYTFAIYDDSAGGTELWPGTGPAVHLIETDPAGLWNAELGTMIPIPSFIFTDTTHWLEVVVDDGTNPPETLPRIHLVTGPFAFQAVESESAVSAAIAQTTAPDAVNSLSIVDGSIQFGDIGPNGAVAGQVMKWNGAAWVAADDATSSGAASGWVDDGTVVRLQTAADSVGIGTASPSAKLEVTGDVKIGGKATIGPGHANTGQDAFVAGVTSSATGGGATISGGADHTASGLVSTIGGGQANIASGTAATISGGAGNTADSAATVGGGFFNHARGAFSVVGGGGGDAPSDSNAASGDWSTVGGGKGNRTSAKASTIAGGSWNTADTGATVGGGAYNMARGHYSVVAGGGGPNPWDSNSASGNRSFVGGGMVNVASSFWSTVVGGRLNEATARGAFVGGGESNAAVGVNSVIAGGEVSQVDANFGTISGGGADTVTRDAEYGTIGGGVWSVVSDTGATISGGVLNRASGIYSVIGGGKRNRARGDYSTVCGGGGPLDSDSNSAQGRWSFCGGGSANIASATVSAVVGGSTNKAAWTGAFVGGGYLNTAWGTYAVITGGQANYVEAHLGTIGGGAADTITGFGENGTIGGGTLNVVSNEAGTISGGRHNHASGAFASIGGGYQNAVSGRFATVPGGDSCTAAGRSSFAAGRRAKALHDGCFVWADTMDADFPTFVPNEFAIRATGGFRAEANTITYGALFRNNGNGDGLRSYGNVSQGFNWASVYAVNNGTSPAFYGTTAGDTVAYLNGDVVVTGFIHKLGGGFHIDHPLDPENKYLNHSFVESPDMKNIYDGTVTLDGSGSGWVTMPDWFDALNSDFHYQLTAIGAPGPNLHIAEEIAGNRFRIAGGEPGMRVSWQVTGIRKDASANRNRLVVEEWKPDDERGRYLDARAFGQPKSAGIGESMKLQ